jgi:hypothetical protein
MNSGSNHTPYPKSNAVDMSSTAISSRLREVSELHQLGLSLAKAKPMAHAPQAPHEKDTPLSNSQRDIGLSTEKTAESGDDDKS